MHTVLDDLTKPAAGRHLLEARACDAYASYGHTPAILGAIDSIHWLHDWRNSSLVAAVALGDAL